MNRFAMTTFSFGSIAPRVDSRCGEHALNPSKVFTITSAQSELVSAILCKQGPPFPSGSGGPGAVARQIAHLPTQPPQAGKVLISPAQITGQGVQSGAHVAHVSS